MAIPGGSVWTEDNLEALVRTGVEERIDLEYKDCRALAAMTDRIKDEISKDVSAFANSIGGRIIYGITEDKKTHKPLGFDDGLDPTSVTKEWLEQVIVGGIRPLIEGLTIYPVALNRNKPGRVAYVVDVPQAITCHQARDRRYYKRRNFMSEPMEDYEVRDVMNRVKHPRLEADISYVVISQSQDEHKYELVV